jgi:hypothetical protein
VASAYTILHNYQQELYTPNLKLIDTALQAKQQPLNANRQKLQTMRDQFTFLDVAKQEDQDHLEDRLRSTMMIVDKYSHLDLSSANLSNQLISTMTNVIDDDVTNSVISTKRYRAEEADWAKLQTDSPDKYSQANHEYARQASNAWLSDGKRGSMYRGGGGVIEYQDVEGKISKQIPEIAKSLNAEWKELADGTGYFRDVITRKRVDRGKLEQALDGLLNEKDRKQLQINAWAQYDQMPDEMLAERYNSFYAPAVNNISERISSTEDLLSSTKDPALRARYQASLDSDKEELASYQAGSYENIVSKYGREGAYNTLYTTQFKENYLSAYSKDEITDIATYDNDVKSRNHQLELDKFAEVKAENLRKNDRFLMSEANKLEAASLKAGGANAKPGDANYVAPLSGDFVPMVSNGSISAVDAIYETKKAAVEDVKNLFGITNDADLRGLKGLIDQGLVGNSEITFNGKTVKMEDARPILLAYQNNILNKSPLEKEAMDAYVDSRKASIDALRKLAQGEDTNFLPTNEVPRFNFMFVKDEKTGGMKRLNITNADKSNYYAQLLTKKQLTEEEEYTLGVYYSMHLLMDPNLTDDKKKQVFDELHTGQFSKLNNTDYKTFPNDIYAYNRMKTRVVDNRTRMNISHSGYDEMMKRGFFDRVPIVDSDPATYGQVRVDDGYRDIITEISNYYSKLPKVTGDELKKVEDKIKSLENILITDSGVLTSSKVYGTDKFLSDIDGWDARMTINGDKQDVVNPWDVINTGITLSNQVLESGYKDMNQEPSLREQKFSPSTSGYSKLATLAGLPADSKLPITLVRGWDPETNRPNDQVYWYYEKNGEKLGYYVEDGDLVNTTGRTSGLSAEDLRTQGIINFGSAMRTAYDASWGKNAPVLDLGNNTYSNEVQTTNYEQGSGDFALNSTNFMKLSNEASQFGKEFHSQIVQAYKGFQDGAYHFKLEAIQGAWYYTVNDGNGNRLGNPQYAGASELTEEEVNSLYGGSQYVVNEVMYNYLAEQINKARANYALSWEATQAAKATQQ